MEQTTINLLSPYMPMVKRYESQFLSLNTLLSKTTLTGKISSLDIAENLFDYMEKTQEKFESLQEKLIETIMEQNFLNAYEEAETSIKTIAQTLNFYFSNRHEDISTLSKSQYLLSLALTYTQNKATNMQNVKEALEAIYDYVYRFGTSGKVYKSIALYNAEGELLKGILENKAQPFALRTKMPMVLEANGIDTYGEFYQKTDFYVQKIIDDNEGGEFFFVIPLRENREQAPLLSIVFVVDIASEFNFILNNFSFRLPQSNLIIMNAKNTILFSDNTRTFSLGQLVTLNTHEQYTFLESRSKTCIAALKEVGDLSGFSSIVSGWKICRAVPLYVAFDAKRQQNYEVDSALLENSLLITEDLDTVIAESENINEELGDVVINGEIIASKSHSYALNPILNNIRILSEEMNTLCVQSTGELQKGIYNALFNVVEYYAKYSTLVVDSLFKECIKDSIWIRNTVQFRRYFAELEKGIPSDETLNDVKNVLGILKENYKNFYNVILFDKLGNVLHNSLDNSSLIGKSVDGVDRLNSGIEIYLSNFTATEFYNNKKTIIFYSGIKDSNQRFVGGVAYVLDLDKINMLLKEALPKDSSILSEKSEIFGVIFDGQKNILASTKENFNFDDYSNGEETDFKNLKDTKKIVKIGEKYYLVCTHSLDSNSAFVEHTRRPLYAVIFVMVKEEAEEIL